MIDPLRRVFREEVGNGVHLECRHCGTDIDWSGAACPACGSREVARYEL